VHGPGEYTSPDVQVKLAGTYVWVASYSGDANNQPATHACGQTEETTVVDKASPGISTQVAAGAVDLPNASLVDTATLTGGTSDPQATGTITFRLYGPFGSAPNSASCSENALVGTKVVSVTNGNGSYVSPAVAVSQAGYYTWVATYSGDANNLSATHPCGQASETVQVRSGALGIVKSVSPVAGNGVVVEFGDTLTYTLTVSATGTSDQPNVVVTDYLPGFDPARPTSGKTTYVAGSAKCIGAGTCTVTGPDASHLLTWSLGTMAGGTTRQVSFQVTINDVTGAAGETVAVDILNAGAVQSDRTPKKPSNQVITPVSKVLPVKVSKPPVVVLPHTGVSLPVGPVVGGAVALLGMGLLLVAAAGRRRSGWTAGR
jgi:uncharacterized repeat protein (TIGR01451 family)